jgi:hypothetical protein
MILFSEQEGEGQMELRWKKEIRIFVPVREGYLAIC